MPLTAYLGACDKRFDLVMAADTLLYLGDLSPVFQGVAKVLDEGGALVFTAERFDGEGYELNRFGRYAHGEANLRDCLAAAGFQVRRLVREPLRTEGGEPVPGLVVTAVWSG